MIIRSLFAVCTALAITLGAASLSAAPTTEVIPLNHGLAEDIIPALQPLLDADERVSAYGNQLIIRAEPQRIEQVRALLTDLDRQPRKLRISVSNDGSSVSRQSGYQVDGRIGTGAGDIVVGRPGKHNQARVIRRETSGANDDVHVVTANEGYPVLIQTGQSVPLSSTTTNIYGQVVQQTDYRDVTSGFYATVRVNGDIATINISANNDQLQSRGHRGNQIIDVQRTDTVVTARLGEWVTIGGLDEGINAQDSDIGRRTTTRSSQQRSVQVKVERLD